MKKETKILKILLAVEDIEYLSYTVGIVRYLLNDDKFSEEERKILQDLMKDKKESIKKKRIEIIKTLEKEIS